MIGRYEKIQHYSTKDGPGIRSTVFLCGCNLRCKWCANPELMINDPTVLYYKEKCQHCGLCVDNSNGSIKFSEVGCNIDRKNCENILDMVDLCPFDAYETIQKEIEDIELVDKLLKDKSFYDKSNGGVTFSGGEALLQKDFVLSCAKLLHKNNVHVTLDTAGNVKWDDIKELIDEVDLVLYDVKAFDEDIHVKCTGVQNKTILENLINIDKENKPIIVRMIMVPTYNDDIEDIKKRIDYCAKLKNLIQIDFLEYHIYGVGKYEKCGLDYELKDIGSLDPNITKQAVEYANSLNIKNTIGG